jgi:Fe-Mn family superoxide dismutase
MPRALSRRDALKTLALAGAGALLARGGDALAQGTATTAAPPAPAPATGPFRLPPLPYAADALEPYLDAATMTLHHGKHHATYVNNLNKAVAGRPELETLPLETLLRDHARLPEEVRTVVRNHGGGHHNHSLLWSSLSAKGPREPAGALAKAIDAQWGSFPSFVERFNATALGVFGSGWAWLVHSPKGGLAVVGLPNQDSPLMQGMTPLLGCDVWEHAYYLKFQNRRAEYLAAFTQVVDWGVITERHAAALKG